MIDWFNNIVIDSLFLFKVCIVLSQGYETIDTQTEAMYVYQVNDYL